MVSPHLRRAALLALPALFASSASASYTFDITDTPTQCGNLSVSISGSGSPPYMVTVVPFGASPLPNNTEVRRITSANSSDTTVSFALKFPANSAFVMVVSDATGFGSGGTSGAAIVQPSSDSSCFDPTKGVTPDFVFNISPDGQLTECSASRLWWNQSDVQGTPFFYGVIPGGESFAIPESNLNTTSAEGQGFQWTPNVRGLTQMLLVASDNRGIGSGGSAEYTVNANPQNINSCLSGSSPSSTPGSPAGGSYPTTTDSSSGSSDSGSVSGGSSKTNIGAIVGGVVGGVFGALAILLVILFFLRRRRHERKHRREGDPVDLLQQNDEGDAPNQEAHALPRWYEPEPFLVPPAPTDAESSSVSGDRAATPAERERLNSTPGPSGSEAATSLTTGTRKSAAPPSLRPVNVIQHDDAGTAPVAEAEESETVELPPAYTNIRR